MYAVIIVALIPAHMLHRAYVEGFPTHEPSTRLISQGTPSKHGQSDYHDWPQHSPNFMKRHLKQNLTFVEEIHASGQGRFRRAFSTTSRILTFGCLVDQAKAQ